MINGNRYDYGLTANLAVLNIGLLLYRMIDIDVDGFATVRAADVMA